MHEYSDLELGLNPKMFLIRRQSWLLTVAFHTMSAPMHTCTCSWQLSQNFMGVSTAFLEFAEKICFIDKRLTCFTCLNMKVAVWISEVAKGHRSFKWNLLRWDNDSIILITGMGHRTNAERVVWIFSGHTELAYGIDVFKMLLSFYHFMIWRW